MRIVSLLPSATEIVWAIGQGPSLVGRSDECDYPASVRSLPVVMRARAWDGERPSAEIDARVRRSLAGGESLYELDLDRLAQLRPDLLITQDLCAVCSVTEAEVQSSCAVAGIAPRIVSVSPRTLDDVVESFRTIAAAIGVPEAGDRLAREFTRRLGSVRPGEHSPTIAVLEWLDPPIVAGLWTIDLIERAGARPYGVARPAAHLRTTWDALEADPPDLVVVAPCSFPIERTRRELARDPNLSERLARIESRFGVLLADESYFSRPGPRLAGAPELLRQGLSGAALPRSRFNAERLRPPLEVSA